LGAHSDTIPIAIAIFSLLAAILACLLIEIRRRKRAEGLLKQCEERMAFAFSAANIGHWKCTRTGSFWASEHCRPLLGIDSGAPLSYQTIRRAVHPDDRGNLIAFMQKPADTEDVFEFRVIHRNGHQRWLAARRYLRLGERATPAETYGIFKDISARKAAEGEALIRRQEITHLMRVRVVGELSGATTHELNQPLAAILSNAQAGLKILSQDRPDLAELADALTDIVNDDNRAAEIIRRVRRLLKKEQGRFDSIDLNEVIASTLHLLNAELISRRIKIEKDLDINLPRVWGDGVELQQILLNLMMNAMDAMGSIPAPRRVISVITRASKVATVDMIVRDRGRGVTIDLSQKVFEPFFTTKKHGLGLGLPICSAIATAHGGKISLVNASDGGAIACLTLPAIIPQDTLAAVP
jgi:C4-dicarboxylate-specific signal transduction histidine kinase